MLTYVVQGATLGLSAAATPGPFQAFLITRALHQGWRRSLLLAAAPLLSDGPIIAIVLLILAQVPPVLLDGIRIVGGLFVIWLARGAFRSFQHWRADSLPRDDAHPRNLLKAALINALSPGPWLFWSLLMGPTLLAGWRQAPANGVGFLLGFYVTMIAVNGLLIIVMSTARRLGPQVTRYLTLLSAVALFAFGLYQLATGISALL